MGLFFLFFNVFSKTFTQPFQQLPTFIGFPPAKLIKIYIFLDGNVRLDVSLKRGQPQAISGFSLATGLFYFFCFGRLAPYFERRCVRFATPAVSRVPRTM